MPSIQSTGRGAPARASAAGGGGGWRDGGMVARVACFQGSWTLPSTPCLPKCPSTKPCLASALRAYVPCEGSEGSKPMTSCKSSNPKSGQNCLLKLL